MLKEEGGMMEGWRDRDEEEYFLLSCVFCDEYMEMLLSTTAETEMLLELVFAQFAYGALTARYNGEGRRVFAVSRINK